MSVSSVDEFARAHLPADLARELAGLVGRLISEARVASSLATLVDPRGETLLPAVDLEPNDNGGGRPHTPGTARFEDLGLLGQGAMGEVRRVRDRDLNRVMAMKVIRAGLMERPAILARFLEEAQCSAQLQHPGIVPVHEIGRLPDGRVYFTMREVRGRTLGDIIWELHAASPGVGWQEGRSGWTFRRLLDAFVKVCEAVGYAHARAVVHRDLKPDNVMVGEHGEVLVVDWGLAKVRGLRDRAAEAGDLDVVVTDRSTSGGSTRVGVVAGTPAYMAPEQARGEVDRIDARSDVYALGAVLYEILSGRPPYEGPSGHAVLSMVLEGPPEPPGRACVGSSDPLDPAIAAGPPLPDELVAVCRKAMARAQEERYGNAAELAAEVTSWLEGARRREQALDVVERAAALGPEAEALRAQANALRGAAAALLAHVQPWEPEARKVPGWAKEEEAAALERRIEALDLEAGQRLKGALQIDPAAPEAHAALARRHLAAHAAAEDCRDERVTAREEALLHTHVAALPPDHPVRRESARYLKGDGALTLVTDPPGVDVQLFRYVLRNRRLVPVFERALGQTPLRAVPLSMGSYLCVLRHPGCAEVRYPVSIGRGEQWTGHEPGALEASPVHLPRPLDLGADDVYVPPGWFWSGGDAEVAEGLPRRRLWCPGLVVKRFPVTNTEYIAFLDDLVAQGREEDALLWAPRDRAGALGEEGALSYGRDAQGRFTLVVDAEGDAWLPDWPVINVNFGCAMAYARWAAARTGRAWRLPLELEWEKAARGVDGRFFPWGDMLDPSWCCIRDSHADRPVPAVVDSFPVDESVYGVRGMSGNVEEWCVDPYRMEGPDHPQGRVASEDVGEVDLSLSQRRARRGGYWYGLARYARCCSRYGNEPSYRFPNLGFRLVRAVGPAAPEANTNSR